MADEPLTAILAVYPNRSYAVAASDYLNRMEREGELTVEGIALVVSDLYGKLTVEEIGAPSVKRGAKRRAAGWISCITS